MHTNESQSSGDRRRRRSHSDEFKADAIAAAGRPNVSIASLALSLGINANLLRRWVREAEVSTNQLASKSLVAPLPSADAVAKHSGFVPVQLPPPAAPSSSIQFEIRRGAVTIAVSWPASFAAECGVWLREVLR